MERSGAARLRARLMAPAAVRRWYPGGGFGALYLLITVLFVWSEAGSLAAKLTVTALCVGIAVGFLALPPLLWNTPVRRQLLGIAGFAAYTCLLFPIIGTSTLWAWVYVACVAAITLESRLLVLGVMLLIAVAQALILVAAHRLAEDWYSILLTFSIGAMMLGMAQQIQAIRRLRDAQTEIARLAVIEERARFSRDLHDVLGHSLTVVTVKTELATRLVDLDPERAKAELADIERLSRAALADLRAAVAGYREMSLDTELAAARAALAAADVEAVLPVSGDTVETRLREPFAWVLREAVTNVIRHARARRCVVELGPRELRVTDDGIGVSGPPGSGLHGLAERAGAAGAELRIGAAAPHGTVVTVVARPEPEAAPVPVPQPDRTHTAGRAGG